MAKPLSFAPLDFDQALTALLQVKPPDRKATESGTVTPRMSEAQFQKMDSEEK